MAKLENANKEIISSGVRSSDLITDDLLNINYMGAHIVINTTNVTSVGSVTIDGLSGSVDSITVNGVEIMGSPELFDTDLPTTANNIAGNINSFITSPDYVAVSSGATITITSLVGGGGFAVVSTATTITTVDVDMVAGQIVPVLEGKDNISGAYYNLLTGVAISSSGTTVLKIFPSATEVNNSITNDVLPINYRFKMNHNTSLDIEYSVGINLF